MVKTNREETKEKLQEELKKIKEEFELQKWGAEKTSRSLEVMLKEAIQKGKEVEKAMARDEALLKSIGEGVTVVDMQGKILFVNHVFEELLGWKQDEVIGKSILDIIPREDEAGNRISFREIILPKILAGKKVTTTTTTTTLPVFYFVRKNKTRFPVSIVVTPVIINNKIVGSIELFRDITEEKKINKAKSEFVSLASHQLRTPLTTLSWISEILSSGDNGKLNQKQKQYADEIYEASRRMINLVNAMLNVSRLELGTFTIEPKLMDIREIVKSCIKELLPQILKKKIIFREKYDKSTTSIFADPRLLDIVLENLFSNAVKYTPAGGRINFTFGRNKDNLSITVADTGVGIPKSQQDKISTKLFRADNAKLIDPDGTGLGLYIVKEIIDHAGGKIWFESQEGKGTIFHITLPLSGMAKQISKKELV